MTSSSEFFDEPPAAESSPREVHLAEYLALLMKRRKIIALCVGLTVAFFLIRALMTKPSYGATAVLSIEPDSGTLLDMGDGSRGAIYNPEFLPTQMRLLKSREISERVVRKLNLGANRQFNPDKRSLKEAAGKPLTEADIPFDQLAGRVQGCIEVQPIRGTNLVELTCSAPSSQLAADIANAVAQTYIDWTLEAKFRILNQSSQFLGAQIEQLKSELDQKERDLLAYGREKDIISVDPRQNVTLQKLETLNRDYASAVGDRVSKEAKDYEARTASPESLANTVSSGLVAQLQSEVARLERDYAEKLNLYKPEWPAMEQLKIQIEKSRQHLASVIDETVAKARQQAHSDYLTALRREESLRNVMNSQKSEAMTLNTNAVEYNNLRIEVETKRTLLDSLLKKQAETEVMSRLKGERVSNIRIVDAAQASGGRSSPSYKRSLATGLFLGLGLGIGLAFLLSYVDRSFYSLQQVEEHVKLPGLGLIPRAGAAAKTGPRRMAKGPSPALASSSFIELLPHTDPRSPIAEAYRSFRTALLLSRAGGVRSIVMTSCFPEEGKTATAANLAVVMSQLEKRVVVVDADLHRPRMHEVFGLSNKVGLVSVLAEDLEPSQAILDTSVPGVYLIPAGPQSPNPSGLLSSERMSKLLELAQMNFDCVIVDTPPLFPVADVLVFAHQTDGVVLCVRAGKTPREPVLRARDRILRSRAAALGVVLNGLDASAAGYGYGKGYMSYYGLGADEEEPAPRAARDLTRPA
jgi:capsular exopolysaccharide synthesis family protein